MWDRAKRQSNRLLDRLLFKAELENPSPSPDGKTHADTTTTMAYGRIEMTSPLYLGDMSFGALSGVPNVALARTADLTGIVTGTGEGGLHPEVRKCKRITVQWASARFGVDIDVLNTGLGVVIKIGQGAKPGIGGHLPGVKVTKLISETRRIPVGVDAISPAPHHDIYSIEDLGQRIMALKEAVGKPVFVKVGATNYIPYIASGVARMGADGIIIDGHGAGTGATPEVVRSNVGLPIEIAVPVVDSALRREGLREGFTVVAAGRVSSAEDSAKLIALGADVVSLGTASLIAMGCIMVHKCHLGFCPAVITNKIEDNPTKVLSLDTATRWVVNMVKGWTEEMKLIMDAVGVSSVGELVGRRDLLTASNADPDYLQLVGVEPV
ncbi:MAG: FMN-binding glutamate synthase family protein [Candidatus Caldarchaeum sp.]|nr:FMN-binding glutamate synthase family protein [Candidatus Caldarchaeum sp.]